MPSSQIDYWASSSGVEHDVLLLEYKKKKFFFVCEQKEMASPPTVPSQGNKQATTGVLAAIRMCY
jgi:hypothetical protein